MTGEAGLSKFISKGNKGVAQQREEWVTFVDPNYFDPHEALDDNKDKLKDEDCKRFREYLESERE